MRILVILLISSMVSVICMATAMHYRSLKLMEVKYLLNVEASKAIEAQINLENMESRMQIVYKLKCRERINNVVAQIDATACHEWSIKDIEWEKL